MTRRYFAIPPVLVLPVAMLAVTLLSGGSQQASAQEVRLRTRLRGPAIGGLVPSGGAAFRSEPGRMRFSAEVEDVNLPEGTLLRVSFLRDGVETALGTLTLGPPPVRGGDLNLDTGNGDIVPEMFSGDIIIVRRPNGRAILAGIFP